ncbi:hypothetical protein KP509_23G073000 [Ceratopteris richardii]|uniref:RING-type E3 ubiquitin transferase n=1 Tax=Ceratopteris richardii TaxID=49495 RepID=A0A8T2S3M4_CERRI|nr:hypothetical protein KP509_23G073000 [Ceratopteris richardii]
MVNLTIRLSKGSGGAAGGAVDGGAGPGTAGEGLAAGGLLDQAVTVSCPDHLVLADLPVAKALGSVSDVTLVKVLGRKARRRLGDKVHFCVRCDFPIAIYGRLDPCEHIFCLTCARKDTACYLCGERILRIQRLEVLDGIFICGAPRCLRSFIKRQDFQVHVKEAHTDLIENTDDREKIRQDVDSQKGAASQEPQVQTQALSRSSSGVQLSQHEQKSGSSQLQISEGQAAKGVLQKPTTPTPEEGHTQKSDIDQQKHQSQTDGPHKTQNERQQVEEIRVEEQNVQSDVQQAFQPPQQPLMQQQPSLLPAPQPGIPIFPPPPFPPPYPVMQHEGMNMQPMYPVYPMPPAGGHLLPSPSLPPPWPPTAPPPPLIPPPPPKRGKYEPGVTVTPPSEPQGEPHNYMWPSANPVNYDANRNYGGWPTG